MNEARPYVMQIAAAAWLVAGMAVCLTGGEKSTRWAWIMAPAAVVIFGASMLGGVILAAAGLVLLVALARRRTWPAPGAWAALALGGILCLLLAWYYQQTLAAGNGGARLWPVGASNVAFAAYELLGFAGMGSGRLDLRAAAHDGGGLLVVALLRPYALALGALALAWLGVVLAALARPHRGSRGLALALTVAAGLAALFLFIAARIAGFPFWGRHLAPLLPFIVTAAMWAAAGLRGKALWRGTLPGLLIGLLLISSLLLRIAPRHRKEDNRASAGLASAAARAGARVWWSASTRTAAYYGLSLTALDAEPSNTICNAANLSVTIAPSVPPPDLVFVCKPDVFDGYGSLAAYLAAHAYRPASRLPGFVLWKRPVTTHP